MDVVIRDASPDTDYDRVAALLRLWDEDTITADTIRRWDENRPAGLIRRRAVAVDASGEIVGYSLVQYHPRSPTGRFYIECLVDKRYLRRGIGTRLYDEAVLFAQAQGAVELTTTVPEASTAGLEFARKRDFVMQRHTFASSLDLTGFDETPFAGLIERVESSGIHFSSLAAEGMTPENKYQVWDLNRRTANDNPGNSGEDSFPTFETFEHQVLNAGWFRADGQFLAIDGERFIGLGAVLLEPEAPENAYNAFTGVDRAYRGRGIAQALKLLTIQYAIQHGARKIGTHNDSQNVPMLTINRRFGYQPQPGLYHLLKK